MSNTFVCMDLGLRSADWCPQLSSPLVIKILQKVTYRRSQRKPARTHNSGNKTAGEASAILEQNTLGSAEKQAIAY